MLRIDYCIPHVVKHVCMYIDSTEAPPFSFPFFLFSLNFSFPLFSLSLWTTNVLFDTFESTIFSYSLFFLFSSRHDSSVASSSSNVCDASRIVSVNRRNFQIPLHVPPKFLQVPPSIYAYSSSRVIYQQIVNDFQRFLFSYLVVSDKWYIFYTRKSSLTMLLDVRTLFLNFLIIHLLEYLYVPNIIHCIMKVTSFLY